MSKPFDQQHDDDEAPRLQGVHWKLLEGRGVACDCELGTDHDAEGNDTAPREVPQHFEGGE